MHSCYEDNQIKKRGGGYKPKDIDIEYCEKVSVKGKDSAIIKFKEIPEVPTAVCMKVYGPYERLYQNYIDLFAWMEKEGWKVTDAPRAVYVDGNWNQEDPEKWLTIIQVPAQRNNLTDSSSFLLSLHK